jgi:hypothetical protein
MSNTTYKGQLTTGIGGGLLARLGSIIGGGATPTYRGDGQPSPGARGFFGAAMPHYKDSSAAKLGADAVTCSDVQPMPEIIAIDRDELAAGKIAIIPIDGRIAVVVPRDLCARDASALNGLETAIAEQQQQ